MAKFERHVFVCTNQRDASAPRGSCTLDGKGTLHGLLKDEIAKVGLRNAVRANKAGCLDQCEHGPVIVVYPEQTWYGFVQPGDIKEIVNEHLLHGRPVDRLRLPDACVNTASCPHKPGAKDRAPAEHGGPGSAEDVASMGVL